MIQVMKYLCNLIWYADKSNPRYVLYYFLNQVLVREVRSQTVDEDATEEHTDAQKANDLGNRLIFSLSANISRYNARKMLELTCYVLSKAKQN